MNSPKQYRKKPVVIEAIQYTGDNLAECAAFCPTAIIDRIDQKPAIFVPTLEGGAYVTSVGDYIIKGVQGEFYPCKADIFAKTYEETEQ